MAAKALHQLYLEHQGKVSQKWSLYLAEYERLFLPYRQLPIRLLEIGVQNGGSLELWSRYFPDAEMIIGCDIDPACASLRYDDPRICVVIGDANNDDAHQKVLTHSPSFDLIIDDGSHQPDDVVRSFARYFPLLENNGLYLVEDLHCSYWEEYQGGLFHPYASMSFFRQLTDVLNWEHWGIDKSRSELLSGFERHYGVSFDEGLLSGIHSVEFTNSLCTIGKASAPQNALGSLVTAGASASVWTPSRPDGLNLTPDQNRNEWSSDSVANRGNRVRKDRALGNK